MHWPAMRYRDRGVLADVADTGQPLTGHSGPVRSVAFSPDGHRLASASDDRSVQVWAAEASPEMLCAKLTANMSHRQWRDWV
jgi:WD40 repeat protein